MKKAEKNRWNKGEKWAIEKRVSAKSGWNRCHLFGFGIVVKPEDCDNKLRDC